MLHTWTMLLTASHPSRVRGSKPGGDSHHLVGPGVSPLAGAWIETPCGCATPETTWSHPSRVRGSKPPEVASWVKSRQVAPLAGAWIETLGGLSGLCLFRGR